MLCVTSVVRILPENIPKHARHPGKFYSSLLLNAQAVSCNMSIKQPLLYFRKSVAASAMASLECGCCGCLSHSISCVYVQICERWKVKEHDTSTGKAIVSLCPSLLSHKEMLSYRKINSISASLTAHRFSLLKFSTNLRYKQ